MVCFAVPPVGANFRVRLSFALPFLVRADFVLPTGLIGRRRVAGPLEERTTFFTPLPARVKVPASGRVTPSVAVPVFLFSFSLPTLARFEVAGDDGGDGSGELVPVPE